MLRQQHDGQLLSTAGGDQGGGEKLWRRKGGRGRGGCSGQIWFKKNLLSCLCKQVEAKTMETATKSKEQVDIGEGFKYLLWSLGSCTRPRTHFHHWSSCIGYFVCDRSTNQTSATLGVGTGLDNRFNFDSRWRDGVQGSSSSIKHRRPPTFDPNRCRKRISLVKLEFNQLLMYEVWNCEFLVYTGWWVGVRPKLRFLRFFLNFPLCLLLWWVPHYQWVKVHL